jgi:aminopeptidase-like protein
MSTQNTNGESLYDEFVDDSKHLDNKVMSDLRNLCHYSCSKINLSNILLLVVIIILIVLLFRK